MKFLIQRINNADIYCFNNNKIICKSSIGKGLLIYIGISKEDIGKDIQYNKILKILKFPFFDDENGKIIKSIKDINGEILLVPNFTLYGRNKKGSSLDYTYSASFSEAKIIFNQVFDLLTKNISVKKGVFGSYMKILSEADGPVNFIYEI